MSDRLVLNDHEGFELKLMGALFAVASPIWFLVHMRLPGLAFLAVGLGMVLLSTNLIITADRPTRTLRLEYRHRFYRRVKNIPFEDIADIRVDRSMSTEHHTAGYQIVVVLTNGRKVPFRLFHSGGGQAKKRQASQLRAFILGKKQGDPTEL